MDKLKIDKTAFESKEPNRGFTLKASYLKEPHRADALVEVRKDGGLLREFLFPAYKIWNLAAHFDDIIDGELEGNNSGYQAAAWTGF